MKVYEKIPPLERDGAGRSVVQPYQAYGARMAQRSLADDARGLLRVSSEDGRITSSAMVEYSPVRRPSCSASLTRRSSPE